MVKDLISPLKEATLDPVLREALETWREGRAKIAEEVEATGLSARKKARILATREAGLRMMIETVFGVEFVLEAVA